MRGELWSVLVQDAEHEETPISVLNYIGMNYIYGDEAEKDEAKGLMWLERAANSILDDPFKLAQARQAFFREHLRVNNTIVDIIPFEQLKQWGLDLVFFLIGGY